MKALLLTSFGALFCALTLLGSPQGLVSAAASPQAASGDKLKVGAFNIQVFGSRKLDRVGVLPVLVDVSLCT